MGADPVSIALIAVSSAMSYSQGQSNARSIKNQNEIAQIQSKFNEELLEQRKAEILEQGEEQAELRKQELRQILGAQKVGFAAQGIEVEGELGETLAEDAIRTAKEDVRAIRNNAFKEAMGIEIDQVDLRLQRNYDKVAAQARSSDAYGQGLISAFRGGADITRIAARSDRDSGSNRRIPTSSRSEISR